MLAKILYKPIGIIAGGIVARRVSDRLFTSAYQRRFGTEAPKALTEETTLSHAALTAAAKATIFAVTAVTLDRAAATGFRYITGFWPGEKRAKPAAHLERSGE
ncbi:unannotated protein [freshwater metagenome]|uniref:Unannotated protein n=1 Tax=freshwater metagenome TaxID=449393 RepID=A0A6J7DYS4_9ZZZZ